MKLYQSFIGGQQRSWVSPNTIPFDAQANTGKNQREYELLKVIWSEQSPVHQEPWGLISWKFQHKSLISPDEFMTFSKIQFDSGADCVFINPMIGNEAIYFNVWEQGSDVGHKGLDKIRAFLSQNMGPDISGPMGSDCFAFCNYFIANDRFWKSYFEFVEEVLSSLDAEATKNSEVGLIYAGSASYARDSEATMRPFIIERLFSSFIANSPSLNCVNFEYKVPHYRDKFGEQLGGFLHKLSAHKNVALNEGDPTALRLWNSVRLNILQSPAKIAILHLDDPSPFFLSPEYVDFMNG
jgi:hypothetical protein